MFRKAFDYILQKLSDISPIKNFIQFVFRNLLNNFIDRDIVLTDFKNGICELNNLPLGAKKINENFLISSPYQLHEGSIG